MKGRTLCGEFVAALGAAALDKRTTFSGAHAAAEAVLALTAAIIGLIGTLHGEVSLVGKSR
jgi:hypothetical protein